MAEDVQSLPALPSLGALHRRRTDLPADDSREPRQRRRVL
eukprot:CAMPEP_0206814788 /NCGR_PEP_ID=MMETSP0975-20121206/8957_1 /ASSEMBLY_ACC=CAM_ASM_000399 /TAXON_ID=483370 /ORGANISM="non described non described, Strain CCMP2097" /LENGTH=39 /DNA_ID= /DNA_START= /DNA_END= /DNA_ORIENTATION=